MRRGAQEGIDIVGSFEGIISFLSRALSVVSFSLLPYLGRFKIHPGVSIAAVS
jgi:hypothetical protein